MPAARRSALCSNDIPQKDTPQKDMSACSRAWSIAEIRDQILLELPIHDILRNLAVCRDWADSSKIREVLFLQPTKARIHNQYTWPNGLPVLTLEPYSNEYELEKDRKTLRILCTVPVLNPFLTTFYRGWNPSHRGYLQYGLVDGRQSASGIEWNLCKGPEVFHREVSSWRGMQVMQPAATLLKFQCYGLEVAANGNDLAVRQTDGIEIDDDDDLASRTIKVPTFGTVYEVRDPRGVTVGKLMESFREHLRLCPDCGHFPDVYDAAGNVLKVWWFDGMKHMRVLRRDCSGHDMADAISIEERIMKLDWKDYFKEKDDGCE